MTKILWMTLRLDLTTAAGLIQAPTALARKLGVTRNTARTASAQLLQSPWMATLKGEPLAPPHDTKHPYARMPTHLITDTTLSAGSRVLFGVLQATSGFRYPNGEFIPANLAKLVHRDPRTVAKAAEQLAIAGWLVLRQTHRKAPVHFTILNPYVINSDTMLAAARRRINRAEFKGEAIMREYLSLLVDRDDFEDNAEPGFLVNPVPGERLQLDRYYPPDVAFEFNGPQHYRPTEIYSVEKVAQQRARDLMKIGICVDKGITLVIVHPEDLSLKALRAKVVGLPLRDLDGCEVVADFLANISRPYRRAARRRKL